MGRELVSFVDTNRHWTIDEVKDVAHETNLVLWCKDYGYVEMLVSADEGTPISVDFDDVEGLDVQLFQLDSTKAFIGHAGWYAHNPKGIMPTGPKVDVDDIIAPYNDFNMPERGYKCIMAKITTSETLGCHKVVFNVHIGGSVTSLTLDVDVLDMTFPEPKDYAFKVEYWHHPYNVAEYYGVVPWSDEHMEILRQHQLLYKSLGGHGVICTVLDEVWGGQTYSQNEIRYPSMVKWNYSRRDGWTFDYTDLDRWIDLNRELGLDDKFICYSMMPWGNKMRYYHQDKGKYITRIVPTSFPWMYRKAWKVFLKDFIRHLDEMQIFDSIYIGFDERNNMGMILDFLDKFTNKDGHHFKVAASFNNYLGNRKCLDRIDSVSVGLDEIREHEDEYTKIAKQRANQGKYTTLYTATEHFPNSFALSYPAESYWSVMYAYSTGNIGFLRWAYDAWVKDPLLDSTHWSFQAGDCFLIYPNRETHVPSFSYRLMRLDEGVRDVNKLAILRQKSELAGRIQELLQKTRANYDFRIEYDSSWGVAIRKAKWATNDSADRICQDVDDIKSQVVMLTREYLEE